MALRADDVDLGRDRDLVERFQNGDPQAFDDLYRRYFDRLNRFCRRHTRDHHEAEEVAQEAFVKALRAMHTLDGERRFYPWMTVIAKRISIDRHRKMSRIDLTDEPDLGSVEPEIEHLFEAVDLTYLRQAMAQLGPRHREVLHLRETEGLSYADIAERLEVPMTTVEALLHRARKALRREYAKASGESRGLWGLPVVGALGTRLANVRDRLGERWVEIVSVGAPAAVAAATAAVVILPAEGPATIETEGAAPAPTPAVVEVTDAEPDLGPAAGTVITPETSAAAAEPPPAEPTLDAGPVDVFVGPEGYDRASDEVDQQPINTNLGPADAGVNPPRTADDVADFVAGAIALLGGASDDDQQSQPSTVESVLGES